MTDNTDSRLQEVTEPYKETYKWYLDKNDNRLKRGLKPITFEEYLWKEAEKGGR